MLSPSGAQFEIAFAGQKAVVVEVGGGLRAYVVDGRAVVHGYEADVMCTAGRGQVLIPWPNRLEDGSYEFEGKRHQLPLTEVEHRNAIHGLVRWAAWTVTAHEPHRVVMENVVHPQPGYPFALALGIEYALSDEGLSVRTTATNIGAGACPYGAGAHPYLTVGTATVASAILRVPGRTVLHADQRGIPTGSSAVEETEYDFREPRLVGTARLDHCFTDLDRDGDAVARIEVRDPGSGALVTLWLDESYSYVMVFTGDLPDVGRRGLAVEPMTCAPNAFRSGDGLIRLEPGESFTSTWGIAPGASPVA